MRLFSAVVSLVFTNRNCLKNCHGVGVRSASDGPLTCLGGAADASFSTASLESIANQYDAFILDQFGVLHNGSVALPGAVEAVEFLYKIGKKLIILSNTSAPAEAALERLPKYGFRPEWFQGGAVTSGEEASKYLAKFPGMKGLFLTWDDRDPTNPRLTAPPQRFLERAGIEIAGSVDAADFLVLHGSEVWNRGANEEPVALGDFIETGAFGGMLDELLKSCADRKLPMVCANPDERVVTPTGGVAFMPGGIARRYQEICGETTECHVFGKPDPQHFRACVEALGTERIVHVGDSMHHDIIGATKANVNTLFISSGIHADELGVNNFGAPAEEQRLAALFQEHGVRPTHILPAFRLCSPSVET